MVINEEFPSFTIQGKIMVNEHVVDRISHKEIVALKHMKIEAYAFYYS